MRLVCPNCGAKYEIDAALLPEDGRDVQCSACGHTWFQRRETLEDEFADEMGATEPLPPDPQPAPRSEPESEPAEPEPELDTQPVADADSDLEEDEEAAPAAAPRARRPDEAALAILREEAEREAAARRREAAGLETQGELGLAGAAAARTKPSATLDEPEAPVADPAPDRGAAPADAHDSRSDVFPDIDEINSSLSAAESEAVAKREAERQEEDEKSSRRGFRIGFLSVVVFVAVLIVLYAFSPRLAEMFPQAQPVLSDYVDWVNSIRAGLEGLMQSAADRIGRN